MVVNIGVWEPRREQKRWQFTAVVSGPLLSNQERVRRASGVEIAEAPWPLELPLQELLHIGSVVDFVERPGRS